MATGLEALGAASAVLQVISFASDVISVCKKIYDGKPTANDHLEEHAKRMSDAAGRVQIRCQAMAKNQPSEYDKKLADIAEDCKTAARDLEVELQFATGLQDKGNIFKAVNATLRASSHRKKVERLELSLSRHREVMEAEMMSHLCSRSDAIELQQKQQFNELAMDVQSLVLQIAQGHTKIEDLVKAEHDVTRQAVIEAQGAINKHVTTEFQALSSNATTEAQRKTFLQSLKFSEINQRYNDLMNSSDASFKRVFASYREMGSKDDDSKETPQKKVRKYGIAKGELKEIDRVWAEFVEWLQSADSLFCIRGKPGSGKSTLVKFIIDNKNTRQLLSGWRSEVNITSHFFWKIGSPPQNSIKGLLCSLVFRILDGNQEMVDHVLNNYTHLSSSTHYHDWSIEDLKAVLYFILEKDTRHQCIFIDGLDEICNKDGLFKLTQLIEEILEFPNVKMCVASRPETIVMNWLKRKDVPGVLLEDLTRPDMRTFVAKELKPFLSTDTISVKAHDKLVEKLVWKAQGVFLWLHLATRSVTIGIQNEDSEDMLLARLEELPSELTQLYADMWQRLNENNSVYRDTAARYFRYALQKRGLIPMFPEVGFPSGFPEIQQPVLFQIACAEAIDVQDVLLTGTETVDFTQVQQLCGKTKLAIQNRCAGLLQIQPPGMGGRMLELLGRANDLDLPEDTKDVDDVLFSRVVFIHRTAHDFLTDTETGQDILKYGVLSERGVETRLLRGLLCLLRVLGSEYGVMGRSKTIFYEAIDLAKTQGSKGLEEAIETLQVIENLYNNKVIGADQPSWQPQAPFLSHLTDHPQLDDFVISSLTQAGSATLATDVLREAWEPDDSLYYNRGRAPSARLVEALISMGADAYAMGTNRKQDMGRMEPFARQGTAFSNLLMYGIKSIDEGKHLGGDSTRELLKVAVSMAMRCPDLGATTLVVGRVKESGQADLMNVTWLSRPENYVNDKSPWLLYEVDYKFLLLHLLSGLGVDIQEPPLGPKVDELLPKLENPSAKIRVIITCNETKALVCHRAVSQLSAPAITEHLFAGDTGPKMKWRRDPKPKEDKSAYEAVIRLTNDPNMERVDLETTVRSLAGEGIGFCTLVEAGIVPSLPDVERWEEHMPLYALTIQQLKATVTQNCG
ncbi:hypothetical protein AK830_g4691 [Neonectria ditissima]|uniref:Uncharacterized protein n=1 Tax=Neonectria ditissima TaxID=78410 RepID=A0A0P7BMF4_9HYPO|nr:hypothetical protein AK830_g4691 [Neonectria ditissima]